MKKSKQSLELDDIDLDVDGDDDIHLIDSHSSENEDIIELTDEILDELEDENDFSDHFDFDSELLDEDDDQKRKGETPAALSEQTTILDDDDLLDEDLLADDLLKELSFEDERSEVGDLGTLGALQGQKRDERPEDLEEDLLLNIGELPDDRPVEEVGFLDTEDPDLGMVLSGAPAAAAVLTEEPPIEMESALDDVIEQLEARMTNYIQQVVEARLPDLVRSILKEEIERLKKEMP